MILDRAMRAGIMAIRSTGYAWIVLACGVTASLGLFLTLQGRVESVAKLRFESEVRNAGIRIKSRIQSYADVLYGVRALFQSKGLVSRREFHDYVESLNLGPRYPGFQILNFEQYVTAEHKAAFEESVRRDTTLNGRGYPKFRISPPGDRPAYYVLTYLEPMEGNEGVFGNDIAMNHFPIILRLFERMRDTNELFSSGRLVTIKGPERYVALSMRLPVYQAGQPIDTVEQRRLAYIGSVGAGFRVRESLDPIIATAIPKPIAFNLYNIGPTGTAVTPDRLVEDNLLYSNRPAKSEPADSADLESEAKFSAVQSFQFGARELVIHFSASRSAYIDSLAEQSGVFALSAGLIITLLLSALVYSLGRSRHQAQLLAAEMTSELQESKAFLTEAQRVARTGSWMLDPTTDELRWSPETYRILGVAVGAPLDREAFLQRVHPEDRDAVDQAWQEARKGERYDIEYRVLVGAEIRWVHEQSNLDFAPHETNRRRVGTVQDITERKRADESLRESEQELRAIFEGALDGILVVEAETRNVLAANSAICSTLGYTHEEIVRIGIPDIHPKQDLPHAIEQFARQLRGEIEMAANIPMMRKDGSVVYADIKASLIRFGGKNCVLGVFRDVAERKRLEEVHLQAQKLQSLGTLAGGIAHDFNNILAAIQGNADLAAEDVGPDHAAAESLEEIRRASARAAELVRRIMAFGRPKEARREAEDLTAVVGEVLKLLRSTLPAAILLEKRFAEDTPHVLADAGQIHEAIVNLTTNAAYAIGPRAGSIEYRLEPVQVEGKLARSIPGLKEGRYARLTVTDNGCGMDAATLERIFDAFYTTKPVGEGTGLGLSMVHGTMRSHGGAVTVESTPGKGSSFALYFPAAKENARDQEQKAAPPARCLACAGQRVLYVDDEEALASLASRVLSRLGHQVTSFTDPEEALETFRSRPQDFDIVVTDLSMPRLSGIELAREVLLERPEMRVLMTTGYLRAEDECIMREAGIREVILKPNTMDELGRVLDAMFRAGDLNRKSSA